MVPSASKTLFSYLNWKELCQCFQERTNSTPGQDELQQQDGVNNPKNTNERNKQSNLTTDNATTTTTPTQAQDTINVRTCEEVSMNIHFSFQNWIEL